MTREHEVCSLSGLVLGPGEMVWQWSGKPSFGRAKRTHNGPPQARVNKKDQKAQKVRLMVNEAVTKLLSDPSRHQMRELQLKRLATMARREFRTRNSFRSLHNAVATGALRAGRALNLPMSPEHPALKTLSKLLTQYLLRLDVTPTQRAVSAMTAAILAKMATGYVVTGVTIVPQVALVTRHGPSQLQHPKLVNVLCRAVSSATRDLVTKTTTAEGYAIPAMAFPPMQSKSQKWRQAIGLG